MSREASAWSMTARRATGAALAGTILQLIGETGQLDQMSNAAKTLAKRDAAAEIARLAVDSMTARGGRRGGAR